MSATIVDLKADPLATFAPVDTPGVLRPLQELPLPAPVSWAPQTVGWALVAVVVLAALAWAAFAAWRHWRKQRYRRFALAQLTQIEAALQDPAQRVAALAAIPPLIKRTSLAAAPRERVASLSGEAWLQFLKHTHGRFDERTGALLALVSYAPVEQIASLHEQDVNALVRNARDWIEHHHVEV